MNLGTSLTPIMGENSTVQVSELELILEFQRKLLGEITILKLRAEHIGLKPHETQKLILLRNRLASAKKAVDSHEDLLVMCGHNAKKHKIPIERLIAVPDTILCVEHQRKLSRQTRSR